MLEQNLIQRFDYRNALRFHLDTSQYEVGAIDLIDHSALNTGIINQGTVIDADGPMEGKQSLYFNNNVFNTLLIEPTPFSHIPNSDFTLELWWKAERNNSGIGCIFAQWSQVANESSNFLLSYENNQEVRFYYSSFNITDPALNLGKAPLGQWVHFAVVRRNTQLIGFRDGSIVANQTVIPRRGAIDVQGTMGAYFNRSGVLPQINAARLNGRISDVRIYNTSFTPS